MNTTSDLNVNHYFCSVSSPYPSQQIWKYLLGIGKSFIAQILKVVSPLRKKLVCFSPLGFEIQKN